MEWEYEVIVAYKRFKNDRLQVEVRKFLTKKGARRHSRESRKGIKHFGYIDKGIEIVKL